MFHHKNDPIQRFLDELAKALKNHPAVARDALSDAREFLTSELKSLQKAHLALSADEIHARFVDAFGRPSEVARGYIEQAVGCRPRRPIVNRHCRNFWARIAAAVLVIVTTSFGICLAAMQQPPKQSPFTEVRYGDNKAIVRVRGDLYELVSLDGIPTNKIVQSAKEQFGNRWQKRFAEDLVEVLWGMGHRPKANVNLQLRDITSGKITTIADAAMTEANRQQVWDARNMPDGPPKLAPFTEVRYDGDKAIVSVRGKSYELVSLDGLDAGKILQSAKDQFGNRWQKRFAEDLVEVLSGMGHRPKSSVKLQLRDLTTGKVTTIDDAAMTGANRQQVWDARNRTKPQPHR